MVPAASAGEARVPARRSESAGEETGSTCRPLVAARSQESRCLKDLGRDVYRAGEWRWSVLADPLPPSVSDFDGFLKWVDSDEFPAGVKASYIDGKIWLEPRMDDYAHHNLLKAGRRRDAAGVRPGNEAWRGVRATGRWWRSRRTTRTPSAGSRTAASTCTTRSGPDGCRFFPASPAAAACWPASQTCWPNASADQCAEGYGRPAGDLPADGRPGVLGSGRSRRGIELRACCAAKTASTSGGKCRRTPRVIASRRY